MASLPSGIDFRDLWRPGSGMTLRRLDVLLRALPYGSPFHEAVWAEVEAAKVAKPDEIKSREQAFYERNARQAAKEAGP